MATNGDAFWCTAGCDSGDADIVPAAEPGEIRPQGEAEKANIDAQ